jgi:hypothetical protein
MTEALTVEERGRTITFTFDDMMSLRNAICDSPAKSPPTRIGETFTTMVVFP